MGRSLWSYFFKVHIRKFFIFAKLFKSVITNFVLSLYAGSFYLIPDIPTKHFLIIGFLGSIISIFGDLCESFLKRAANKKDSGNMFPGHGGALDRVHYTNYSFLLTILAN
jgi:CDP-diglyceride synthetase